MFLTQMRRYILAKIRIKPPFHINRNGSGIGQLQSQKPKLPSKQSIFVLELHGKVKKSGEGGEKEGAGGEHNVLLIGSRLC